MGGSSNCSCDFGYTKSGVDCVLSAAITRADLAQTSMVPSASNTLTVHVESNIVVPKGATVKISKLLNVTLATSTVQWNMLGSGTKQTAVWDDSSATLTLTVPEEIAASATLSMQFTIVNPSTDGLRYAQVEISGWPLNAGLAISKTMAALRVCPVGFFGSTCAKQCFGMVRNLGCKCSEGQFGYDCSQTPVKDITTSIAPVPVAAGAAVELTTASGVGMSLPAGALTAGATLEVAIYDFDVKISDDQPGVKIKPAGPLGVFTPHGLTFAVPVTLTLKYDPTKVPVGDDVFIFYFNEDLNPPSWEQMPGKTVAGSAGLVECRTSHFSTFGPFSRPPSPGAAPSGGGQDGSTSETTPTPGGITPTPDVIRNDSKIGIIIGSIIGGIVFVAAIVGGGVFMYVRASRRINNHNSDNEIGDRMSFVRDDARIDGSMLLQEKMSTSTVNGTPTEVYNPPPVNANDGKTFCLFPLKNQVYTHFPL